MFRVWYLVDFGWLAYINVSSSLVGATSDPLTSAGPDFPGQSNSSPSPPRFRPQCVGAGTLGVSPYRHSDGDFSNVLFG